MINKELFLKREMMGLIQSIPVDTKPLFGIMNVHQMVEHMIYSFKIANGRLSVNSSQPEEITCKMYAFLMSEKPFRENTPNSNLPKEPSPIKGITLSESLDNLKLELNHFFEVFQNEEDRIENPFFGRLNKQEQIQLLHKHVVHHLRQFGVDLK